MMIITKKGFTLVELLVVIAIIGVLATIAFIVLDPVEIMKRGRDSTRIANLALLNNAVATAAQEAEGDAKAVLCSPDGLTLPCTGQSNVGSVADAKKNDGTGWVKVNLTSQNLISVPTLPLDPTNNTDNHYTYCSNGSAWEFATDLESVKQTDLLAEDGGNDPALYEIGSDLTLIAPSGGSCPY